MIKIQANDLQKLDAGLKRYGSILPKSFESGALKRAVRPIFQSAKREVPVGRVKSENGWGKYQGPEYARGGVTRRQMRIQVRKRLRNGGTSEVWVGPNSGPGKVGWRNHFITSGVKGGGKHGRVNMSPNDYLQRAHDKHIVEVTDSFSGEMDKRFLDWSRKNLPQGR